MPEANKTPSNGNGAKRRKLLLGLAATIVGAVLIYLLYWAVWGRVHSDTDDAYVGGNVVAVAPLVAGTVVQIDALDTELVKAGEPLVRLDATDASNALERAKANLAQAVRQVRQMYANAQQLQAGVEGAQVALAQAKADFQRAQDLLKIQGISTENYQHAETAYRSAQAALAEMQHQRASAEAAVADTTLATHPMVKLAEAGFRDAYLALQRTTVVSPVTGYVATRSVQLGQQVSPGTSMLAVIPLNEVWVDANFKETELADVRIGQPVRLTSDLYGGAAKYTGHVAGLSPGTGSAFALLPAQNATGNWLKVVQRLPVRVALDPEPLARHPLRLGLSMTVSVDTGDKSGALLSDAPQDKPAYATSVYQDDDKGVEALIRKIIRDNAPAAPAGAPPQP